MMKSIVTHLKFADIVAIVSKKNLLVVELVR